MPKDKALIAAAGVYYVAFKLSSSGYAVGFTPPGSEVVDLLATKPSVGHPLEFQVKTADAARAGKKNPFWKWRLSPRNLQERRESLFLAFVDLHPSGSENPDVYIVPSADISRIRQDEPSDEGWFTLTGDRATCYKNNWGIISSRIA